MRQLCRKWFVFTFTLLPVLFFAMRHSEKMIESAPLSSITDTTRIYYERFTDDTACGGETTLGEYIRYTLPFEWPAESVVMQRPEGIQAIRAGAVAVRTFSSSVYNTREIERNGTRYLCIYYGRQNHKPNDPNIDNFPYAQQAVIYTAGIILTHPEATNKEITSGRTVRTGAIDAQFRKETGDYTQAYPSQAGDNKPWLISVYDPISLNTTPSNNPYGMGQYGSKRWAWGEDDAGVHFPKWDYRRILAHYYTGVDFVGVTPDPPDDRFNVLQVYGLDPHQGITLGRGETTSGGYSVLVQNTGREIWDVTALDECDPSSGNEYNFQTLLAHHVYQQGGSPACSNCIGLNWLPFCRDDTYSYNPVDPGEHFWLSGYKFFMPNQDPITSGTTYNLRLDILRQVNAGQMQWTGYPNFEWPGQDIPVLVPTPPPPNLPEVRVDQPPAVVELLDLENGKMTFSWSGVNATTFDLDYKVKDITEQAFPSAYNTVLSNSVNQSYAAVINCDTDRRDWLFRLRGRKNGQAGGWTDFGSRTQVYPFAWPTSSALTLTIPSDSNTLWSNPVGMTNLGGNYLFWNAGANRSWLSVTAFVEGPGPGGTMPLGLSVSRPGGVGDYQGNIAVNITNQEDVCGQRSFVIPVTVRVRRFDYKAYLPVIFRAGQ